MVQRTSSTAPLTKQQSGANTYSMPPPDEFLIDSLTCKAPHQPLLCVGTCKEAWTASEESYNPDYSQAGRDAQCQLLTRQQLGRPVYVVDAASNGSFTRSY